MVIPRSVSNGVLLATAWLAVGLIAFLMTVQLLMILYGPPGTWHWPRVYQVTVKAVDGDAQSAFLSGTIEGGATPPPAAQAKAKEAKELNPTTEEAEEEPEPSILLGKADRQGLQIGNSIWVMDNYYRSSLRPPQFRLGLTRLLVEFPEPALLLALLLIYRLRKAQARSVQAEQEAPTVRRLLKDDFHTRAERFAEPSRKDQ